MVSKVYAPKQILNKHKEPENLIYWEQFINNTTTIRSDADGQHSFLKKAIIPALPTFEPLEFLSHFFAMKMVRSCPGVYLLIKHNFMCGNENERKN